MQRYGEVARRLDSGLRSLRRARYSDMTAARQKGTAHETNVVNWLRNHGWRHARRHPPKGLRDEGDIALEDGVPVTIEAKNRKAIDLAAFLHELEAEIVNGDAETGCVVVKRRGTTDPGQFYAVTTFAMWNDLIRQVYEKPKRRRIIKAIDIDTDAVS